MFNRWLKVWDVLIFNVYKSVIIQILLTSCIHNKQYHVTSYLILIGGRPLSSSSVLLPCFMFSLAVCSSLSYQACAHSHCCWLCCGCHGDRVFSMLNGTQRHFSTLEQIKKINMRQTASFDRFIIGFTSP